MAQTYEINLINLVQRFHSDDRCREYLEKLRWPNGVRCPRCKSDKISRIHDRDQFDCDECRYQFSVTAGTIMQDTKLPLWKWFAAVYLIVESKKGISANQLKRMLKVSYKTAWYLCHRIRAAMETPDGLLSGIVEIDETYVGGSVKGKGRRYIGNKALVVGAVERKTGRVRLKSKGRDKTASGRVLGGFARANLSRSGETMLYTDDWRPYRGVARRHGIGHKKVKHSYQEWVRSDVHTNSVEGVWSLFKRSVIGAYHQVSCKHLPAYLDEFEFRFNNRKNPHIFRDAMRQLLRAENIEYKELVA